MARTRMSSALGISLSIHAALLILALFWTGMRPEPVSTKAVPIRTNLVFLPQPVGPGGGGGGNPAPAPPKPAQIPPPQVRAIPMEAVTIPVDPPPALDAPVQTNTAAFLQATGISALAPPGPGGGGRGKGIGPGDGDGLNDGRRGGTGGGDRGPGGPTTPPSPWREVKPTYTGAALAAKIQGSVTLEVEVLANGTVGSVKVIKSLDRVHGLDLEAIRAARQWLFRPGTVSGKPADMLVHLVLDFNLR